MLRDKLAVALAAFRAAETEAHPRLARILDLLEINYDKFDIREIQYRTIFRWNGWI
jgi:hypothetical protein